MRRIRTWLDAASPAVPGAVVVWFGFSSGGYFPGASAIVAIALALFAVLRLTLAEEPLEGITPAIVAAIAAFAALAAWALASSAWSDAPARALLDFNRDLAYLLAIPAFGSIAFRPERFAQSVRFLALAMVIVCGAGLISRTLPDVWSVPPSRAIDRLAYPLTYWNALGLFAGLGTVLAFHLASSRGEPRVVRVLGAAATPVLVTTAYLTFSRGGMAAGIVGLLVFLLVGRPAFALGGLLAALPACGLALGVALGADALSSRDPTGPAAVADGHDLALAVAVAIAGAALIRALALPLDAWVERRLEAREQWPRQRTLVAWGSAGLALVVVLLAVGAPAFAHRQYHGFVVGNRTTDATQRERLLNPGNNGRIYKWDISLDAFEAAPLHGSGAGTFQNLWNLHRPISDDSVDGHSLYMETLGELGLPGLLLLVAGLAILLGGFAIRARGPGRGPGAALLAAGVAWALHAGIDWDWEMPAVTWWVFALGASALAAAPGRRWLGAPGRVMRVGAAVGCLVLAVVPFQVIRSQGELEDAVTAFRAGDCARAIDAALASTSAIGARPEPFEIIGYCDVRLGQAHLAEQALQRAAERDPDSWVPAYGLALVRGAFGRDPRPDLLRARALNPRDQRVIAAEPLLRTTSPRRWRTESRKLSLPLG
jgi:O-antigen ligase